VQGVGFRPFIYRLATCLNFNGYVKNVGEGVEIYLEGTAPDFERFLQALKHDPPPLARVESLDWLEVEPEGRLKFTIDRTTAGESFVFISPDIATCPECLKEIETPGERRYRYPFTNCTNCGPRYTIVKKLPYDRENTTMPVLKCVLTAALNMKSTGSALSCSADCLSSMRSTAGLARNQK